MSVHQYMLLSALLNSKKENINIPLETYDNHFNRHTLPIIKQKVVGSKVVVTVNRAKAATIIQTRNKFIKEGTSLGNI